MSVLIWPTPGVPSPNPPGLAEAVYAIPGSVLALGSSYVYGDR